MFQSQMVRKSKSEASKDIQSPRNKRKKKADLEDGPSKPKRKTVEVEKQQEYESQPQTSNSKPAVDKSKTDTIKKTRKVKVETVSSKEQKPGKEHIEKRSATRKKSVRVKEEKETYTRRKVERLKQENIQDVKPVIKASKVASGRMKYVGAHCSIAGLICFISFLSHHISVKMLFKT